MITNNWYRWFAWNMYNGGSRKLYGMNYDGVPTLFTAYNSSYVTRVFPGDADILKISISDNVSVYGIVFGDGTVAPSPNDYKMSGNNINSSLEKLSTVKTATLDGDTQHFSFVFTLRNNSSASLTISEVGWFGYANFPMMLDRTLLATPVTIPAGEVGTVKYTISITLPFDLEAVPTT